MSKISGKRPVPAVAKGKGSPKWDKSSRAYNGTRGTKSPTGSRPVPTISKDTPPGMDAKNKVRPAASHTPMAAPKMAAGTGKDRAHGGGSHNSSGKSRNSSY